MAAERKFVEDGLKKARLNDFFASRLERAGYGGMQVNRTPQGTQITIFAEKPGMVIGKQGKTIKKLTSDVKQFKLDNPQIEVKEVEKPELNAQMMANRLASALERGWYFRKAGNSTLQQIMDAGALGCEVILAGKVTGPRKRTQKFIKGYIKHSGKAVDEIVDKGFAVAKKKLGIIGVKVRIVPPGVKLPDFFTVNSDMEEAAAASDGAEEAEKQDRGEEIVEELLGGGKETESKESDGQPAGAVDDELDKAVEQAAKDDDAPGKESDDGGQEVEPDGVGEPVDASDSEPVKGDESAGEQEVEPDGVGEPVDAQDESSSKDAEGGA